MALYLLQDKTGKTSKHLSWKIGINDLQQLLLALDAIFNASGNREVALSLF